MADLPPPIIISTESLSPAVPPISTITEHPSRRSPRQPKTPAWLADFQCNQSSDFLITLDTLASSHVDFLAALSTFQKPCSYREAKGCQEWEEAMKQELDALEKNDTWEVVPLPSAKKAIGLSGYSWPVHQNNAFLHGFLDEDIYMQASAGYSVPMGQVCKLKRLFYGQASRQWNLELTSKLLAFDFRQSAHDHCSFIEHTEAGMLALLVYVDDVLITCASESKITKVKDFLHSAFTIKDVGLAKYFLSLEITRSSPGTSITQHKFIRDIIFDTGLHSTRPTTSPLPPDVKLSAHNSTLLSDAEPYRRLVGQLLYLSFTRPDISFGAQQLSQFVHAPCTVHMDAALHLVRYLKGCPERGLFFPASSSLSLTAYCDADWASCTDSHRSLIGYCIFLGQFKARFVLPLHISGTDQLADVFTKSLFGSCFFTLLSKLGLVLFPQIHLEGGMKKVTISTMDEASCCKTQDDETDDVVLK
ncbi:UNVERIFIED_CONTAM: Retrovirus-related Pol polyprotein from transposon RE1 [Sesamum radiatum]|uniref:Retrovirus-related Pol polyprotein from transposon RE1 n=1 Tax=Sesamum radiatum TaxID=300843 RepID=A0AAW2JK00_SESRA